MNPPADGKPWDGRVGKTVGILELNPISYARFCACFFLVFSSDFALFSRVSPKFLEVWELFQVFMNLSIPEFLLGVYIHDIFIFGFTGTCFPIPPAPALGALQVVLLKF